MGLVILISILINVNSVQNFLVGQVTKTLSQRLNTKVSIKHVQLDLLNHLLVQGVYIEDQQQDTLLYAGELQFRITDWFILRDGVPVIKYIGLHDAYANLYRKKNSDQWNYQFIIDAFSTGKPPKKDTSAATFNIDLKKGDLKNVRFNMDDAWVGSDMDFVVGTFVVDADKIDLEKKIIDIDEIAATGTKVILRDYEGGRPPKPKKPKSNVIDTTAFNGDKWAISLNKLDLDNCYFSTDILGTVELQNEFDPEHIRISNINLEARDLVINADTLTAKLNSLSAKERCGLEVKQFKADVRVSPTESICKNLLLQTNNSILEDYYAMHYSRFPDFLDYINKVVMVASLKKSKVDSRDVAYFATVLREYPTILNISGDVKGTVAKIEGKNLFLTDGETVIKGNLKMEGLPDIEKTYIDYSSGELYTSGKGILKYAPELKNNPSVSIGSITRAYFKGDFKGYINNFVLNGSIVSNLGTVVSNVKMKIAPGSNGTTNYTGNVKVQDLNLGILLKQPDLGTVSLNADVDGAQSKAEGTAVNFKTIIQHIEYRNYAYTGINADGKLEKEKFTGNLLIADSNVSMGFYGLFDFSGEKLKIKATANLLNSDLRALKLVQDAMTLSADFDVDWEGNTIDEFTGYAKIYNINLVRNGHKLDLDSVYATAVETGADKLLTISSNAFTGKIQGRYQLSTLPASFQYYMAGYLPNYINIPTKEAPPQDISFQLTTHDLDSLLGVLAPTLSGFNNAEIDGYLNTSQQQLKLNANIPSAVVNGITLKNTTVAGSGDFNTLTLKAGIGNAIMPDTAIKGDLKLNTTLGNDKFTFDITTTSPNALGEAVVKGQALAHGDTLDISIFPSEFYLQRNKWDIAGGNSIVYTDGYLYIDKFVLQSGEQKINIQSENNGLLQSIMVTLSNLKAANIANVAGLSDYGIRGNINGSIKADNIFTDMLISSNIKATDVYFDSIVVGNVNIEGSYDGKKNLVTLNPTTGIYRDDKSLSVYGKLSFDSTVTQKIDAEISLNNSPLAWISPLLHGFVSDISGNLNGKISIKGTSESPDVQGTVDLSAIGMHIDFLGTKYTIPEGKIIVNEKEIALRKMTLYDRYNNTAILSGGIDHSRFSKMTLNIRMTSQKFEVIDLKSNESDVFYGNLIAKFESLGITGPFNDVRVRINKAQPAQKSHLYLPIGSSSNEVGAYSYISFKTNGDTLKPVRKEENKLTISIDALLNPLGEITMIMDPSTGDAINAKGTGNITMEIPPNNEIRMYGRYVIEEGSYNFTLPQLFFKRKFLLNNGGVIQFGGPISSTQLNVDGIYKTRARLYDLLTNMDKELINDLGDREIDQAKVTRDIDVILEMTGSLGAPKLGFKIETPDKSGAGTIAFKRLETINLDDRELFNQVASLLLINSFMPSDGGGFEGSASAGVVSNFGDIFSGTASSQLTNILSKITGDDDIAVDLKYQQYSLYNDVTQGAGSRNAVSLGVKKNLFKDRVTVEVGSSLDWGKPTSNNSNASNFNPVGDFRLQYLLKEGGNLRGNIFRTSSYDVLSDRNIARGGLGITWRKSFNNLEELFGGTKYYLRKEEETRLKMKAREEDTTTSGTR